MENVFSYVNNKCAYWSHSSHVAIPFAFLSLAMAAKKLALDYTHQKKANTHFFLSSSLYTILLNEMNWIAHMKTNTKYELYEPCICLNFNTFISHFCFELEFEIFQLIFLTYVPHNGNITE